MKYISITLLHEKLAQYTPLSSVTSISAKSNHIFILRHSLGDTPCEKEITIGKLKTNSWSLYRMLKKCGICISFSIF